MRKRDDISSNRYPEIQEFFSLPIVFDSCLFSKEITLWRKGDRIRKTLQVAAAPVATPTNNEDTDQIQAFEKVASPVTDEPITTPSV